MKWFIGKDITSRLVSRFNLMVNPNRQDSWALNENVQPITDVGGLLKLSRCQRSLFNLSGSGNTVTCYIVPEGKRWTLKFLRRGSTVVATQVTLAIQSGPKTGAVGFLTSDTAAQFQDLNNLTLNAGDIVGMNETGNAGDTAIALGIWYEEEDA